MMMWWSCLVTSWVIAVTAAGNVARTGESFNVKTEQGPVRGHKDSTGDFYAFYNIPYATAPTGNNKFKAPLPPPTWSKPLDAVDKRIMCPQFILKPLIPDDLMATEDCLTANVFVPDTNEKNLPVLVYVHGGGFQFGYGNWLQKKNLMKSKDVIIVNFNYRLGIRGFLCLGTEDAPGNAGMKDQVALLRWVQKNIAAFGGNPNDVTIAGYSAGSASVDLLMLSKSAEGLFNKVIPESGSNMAAFTVQIDPLQNAKLHAKKLNFTNNVDDINALEEFYKTLSDDDLTADSFLDITDNTIRFGPCLEHDSTEGAFLTESPLSILKKGDYKKVPLLYGFSNKEGLIRKDYFDLWKDSMNANFSNYLPGNLKFKSDDEREEVAKLVKKFYFGEKPVSDETVFGYVDYFTDVFFAHATLWAVKLHAEAGHDQVYLYEYSFVDENSSLIPHTNVRGADHCAQSMAVGDGTSIVSPNEDKISPELKKMKKVIREMWLNFVKTGKPVPKGSSLPTWPAAGPDRSPHMSLGQIVQLRGPLLEERALFWDNIYEKYYREPQLPKHESHAEL